MINLEQKITSIPDKTKGKLTEIKSNQNEKELKKNLGKYNNSIYSMDSFYPTIINVDENKYKVLKSVV